MKTVILALSFFFIQHVTGQNWFQVASNTQSNLRSIDFPSANVGYIVGDDSLLLKTADGGKTWQRKSLDGVSFLNPNKSIGQVTFLDEKVGYIILDSQSPVGLMYQTTNGGDSWVLNSTLTLCLPKKVHFFNDSNAIAVGAGCFSGETIDRLSNGVWQGQQALNSFDPADNLTAVDFLNSNVGFVAGNSNYIFRTTDGGLEWDTAVSGLDTIGVSDILMISDTLAYATYTRPGQTGVLITIDGGLTWNNDGSLATFFYPGFNAIERTKHEKIYLGGLAPFYNGFMQWQRGNFWQYEGVDQTINDLATYGDSSVIAVGDSGYIIMNKDPMLLSVASQSTIEEVVVYPNPVADVLTIESAIMEPSLLVVYDANGRKVFEQQTSDLRKFQIDMSAWHAGLYILKIINSNGVTTKKITRII